MKHDILSMTLSELEALVLELGESNSLEEIQEIKKEVSQKFKEAFIVAFLEGKKINTQEAIKISQKHK